MISLKSLLTEGTGLLKDLYIDKGLSLANALIRRGFTKDQAAAIVGNIWAECTFDHTETGSGGDFGLLQWLGPRKKALQEFANNRKSSIMNLTTQLDFIKYELLDEYDGKYAYETTMFRRAMAYGDSIRDKAEGFARYSERPKKAALAASLPTRKKVAQQIYDLLTGKKRDKWGRLETSKWYGFNPDTKRYETGPNKGKPHVATKKIYTVKSGDSLSAIASKYKTTVDSIKRANKLKSDLIKPGQKLIIK
jgi:LysM repeat protein